METHLDIAAQGSLAQMDVAAMTPQKGGRDGRVLKAVVRHRLRIHSLDRPSTDQKLSKPFPYFSSIGSISTWSL